MKRFTWPLLMGLALVLLSILFYFSEYLVFRDARNTFFYLMQDIAFVPIQVLLVTLIVQQFMSMREKRPMLKKLNMVIGAFFSETGTELLGLLSKFAPDLNLTRKELIVDDDWPAQRFATVGRQFSRGGLRIESQKSDLGPLKVFLVGKRDFLLRLLENPNLLEHETFSELLWSVFHLTEELASRARVEELSAPDQAHLAGDMERAYRLLILEWLAYMKHLRDDYPYLFSLAARTNPFDPQAQVEIG